MEVSEVPMVPELEHNPENGASMEVPLQHISGEGTPMEILECSPTVRNFAFTMVKDIVQLATRQLEELTEETPARVHSGRDRLVEELASLNIETALAEASGSEGHDGIFKVTPTCCPTLPQSGLPTIGSLDYPDAPPTTPLLPDLVKSRGSFTRRLKGGLAKEFLPSPPPPTPAHSEAACGLGSEDFAGRLLHSLSLETSERRGGESWEEEEDCFRSGTTPHDYEEVSCGKRGGPLDRAKLAEYADAVSDDIIEWIVNRRPLPRMELGGSHGDYLCLEAGHMAERIVGGALDEIGGSNGRSPCPVGEGMELTLELKPGGIGVGPSLNTENQAVSVVEVRRLRAYAGRLISEALYLAETQLKRA